MLRGIHALLLSTLLIKALSQSTSSFHEAALLFERQTLPATDETDNALESFPLDQANGSTNTAPGRKLLEESYHLKTALHYLPSAANLTLHSAPILTTHLGNILRTAYTDLAQRNESESTNRYQWNHSVWTFEVVVLNDETIPYRVISRSVNHLLRRLQASTTTNVTWTTIGRIDRNDQPVANMGVVPISVPDPFFDNNSTTFSNTTALEPTGDQYLVTTLDQDGATESLQPLDPHALDGFGGSPGGSPGGKRQFSIDREIFLAINDQAWRLTAHLFQNNRRLIAVRAAVFLWVIYMGITKMVLEAQGPVGDDVVRSIELNSGIFRFGRLAARFYLRVKDDYRIGILNSGSDVARILAESIAKPMREEKDKQQFAMEGEIFVAIPQAGTTKQIIVGNWQLSAHQAPIVHDEL
ncbi:MAG: hypothetical protein LQ342_002030 [Letrouitia transgressa]|nr:MAG: hypothetical protein LQ342_002030 [Letrouitia transgressa]